MIGRTGVILDPDEIAQMEKLIPAARHAATGTAQFMAQLDSGWRDRPQPTTCHIGSGSAWAAGSSRTRYR